MNTTELQNQAIEIRDAENEGENTALRVGTMLLAIIDAFANIVDLDTLQQILGQYAGTTGSGQIYWRHARCVFLASMGAELDAVNGDGWEYTNNNGDIIFNPTAKNLRVVGETGNYFIYTNVLYVHAHTCHAYKWDNAEQKMVEITDSNLPTVITYKNTPAFSQVAIGESYVFQSQSSGPKIAIKISSSETYSFLPDPKKIYAFRDIRQAMLWKPSNQTWVSLTPRVINDLTTGGEGDALSAEMGKELMRQIRLSQIQIYVSGNQLVFAGSTTPVVSITAGQASVPKGGSATIRVEGHYLEGNVTLTITSGSGFSFESGSSVLTKTITMIDATAGLDVPVYFDGTEASTAVIVASSANATAASVSISGTVLPSAYTALEYISGATNGVRPGIASIGSRWELVLQCAAVPSSSQIIICSDAYGGHFAEALDSGVWGLMGDAYNTTVPVTQKSVIIVEFTQKGITMSVGGQTVTREHTTRDNYETVCLFQENATTNFTYTGKVFSAKCLQGGNFNGVPCKRNSDNKQGLYDLANSVFYPIK